MKTSGRGIAKLKELEGLRLVAYQCSANKWTIGYGTRYTSLGEVKEGQRITASEAEQLLLSDLRLFEDKLNELVRVPLAQHEFDALILLIYNIGYSAFAESTLLKKLNRSDFAGAADEFPRWNKETVDGVLRESPGLTKRRKAERDMFLGLDD